MLTPKGKQAIQAIIDANKVNEWPMQAAETAPLPMTTQQPMAHVAAPPVKAIPQNVMRSKPGRKPKYPPIDLDKMEVESLSNPPPPKPKPKPVHRTHKSAIAGKHEEELIKRMEKGK